MTDQPSAPLGEINWTSDDGQPHKLAVVVSVTSPQKNYALKWPEPIALWKWAARNSRRADGKPLAMVDFFKRSVRGENRQPGETHEAFVRRSLFAELRALVVLRQSSGGNVPPWIEESLAKEIAQAENFRRVGN